MITICLCFSEGNASQKALLGGKGAGLAEMTNIGYRFPKVSQSQLRRALNTMMTEKKFQKN
jgi:phosphoenolpyruvate synthase/pyruvate phosphate dikinase